MIACTNLTLPVYANFTDCANLASSHFWLLEFIVSVSLFPSIFVNYISTSAPYFGIILVDISKPDPGTYVYTCIFSWYVGMN